ncbi:hypothetical protein BU24DRAFT_429304 [Aaosphaeria arxii CBS 175.79]|uniref:Hepatocellular carcinoma-associated antigen 59-domain-containing protein n=1 Tax=Aaosphaeria arxii CBS 175.79 TaxID=1450172 RepID=A0A6A5X672_9PLEO|nr:uncharacterized protein BU24DRAFT_429304 [Aaosphaeria arxii CBS 175.79]KAF2008449.1 hypothetical protein BU24DRAFT_429304 [Aaosphaeria arxii CBS 175.79]
MEGETTAPPVRFKRRKLAHPRRSTLADNDDAPSDHLATTVQTSNGQSNDHDHDNHEDVPNLKEILRNRRRPHDRLREAARKAEQKSDALVHVEQQDLQPRNETPYVDRFVAQTGQVVGKEDQQMAEYVEARLAEQNHRKYGWPIPDHLQKLLGRLGPTSEGDQEKGQSQRPTTTTDPRLAAGHGKLMEIDLGPEATAKNIERTEQARRRLEGHVEPDAEEPQGKVRLGKDGKPRKRWQKRRNSEDIRRDAMVEAVLRESKLEYFEEAKPAPKPTDPNRDADDAIAEQFRLDFLESIENRHRRAAPPPNAKGAKEHPKGPKLGGSRSARAAMRAQEEQAAKMKK